MGKITRISLFVALGLAAAACTSTGSVEPNSTATSVTVAPLSSSGSSTTEVAPPATTTSTPAQQVTPPLYRIVERLKTDEPGDTVVVLLDDTSYDSLTDIDLYDIIAEVVELFPPISEVHIVDDVGAANTVTNPDATSAERQAISSNYLARLEKGFTIIYLGPFSTSGTAVLGS